MYASRALRAQQTAAPVAAAHGLAVEVVDGVQEVSVGDLEGRSDTEALAAFDQVYQAWARGDLGARMPGGESALDLRARFLPVVEELVEGVTDGDVLLVSHGAAVRLARRPCWARRPSSLRAQRRPGRAEPRRPRVGGGLVGPRHRSAATSPRAARRPDEGVPRGTRSVDGVIVD